MNIRNSVLNIVDEGLQWFIDERLSFFQIVSQERAQIQDDISSFESMLKAELYGKYQNSITSDSVFLEWPGVKKERFDMYLNNSQRHLSAYLEFKMYYRKGNEEYSKDFRKLKELIDMEKKATAVQIHFNLYQNRNRPNHVAMENSQRNLNTNRYCSNIKTIGEPDFHFYRLAFWLK